MPPKRMSGYSMFVHKWRETQTTNISVCSAYATCEKTWRTLNEDDREEYTNLAKTSKSAEQLNCLGQAVSEVESGMQQIRAWEMKMKSEIERIVLDAKSINDLENIKFVFAAFNYFSKPKSSNLYVPAEFSACEFSLKSGRNSIFSSLINPGEVVYGHYNQTMHHASTTHQLPMPPKAMGESNMAKMHKRILEFIREILVEDGQVQPLVVYTSTDLLPIVRGCFKYMESKSEQPMAFTKIHFHDIQQLLFMLKKRAMSLADKDSAHIKKSMTDNWFCDDAFEYHEGTACQFHTEKDRGKYCTKSIVSRWCYMFSDIICSDLDIKPVPGRHMPPDVQHGITAEDPMEVMKDFPRESIEDEKIQTGVCDLSIKSEAATKAGAGRDTGSSKALDNWFAARKANGVWNVPPPNNIIEDLDSAFEII